MAFSLCVFNYTQPIELYLVCCTSRNWKSTLSANDKFASDAESLKLSESNFQKPMYALWKDQLETNRLKEKKSFAIVH